MDNIADGETHEECIIVRSVTTFNCLPPEILTQLIVNLEGDDRKNFGSLNNRLERLERLAGHRRFSTIEFNANCPHLMKAYEGRILHNFNCLLPVENISAFFHQAVAEKVEIKSPSLKMHEDKLLRILKNVKFRKLDIEINSEESYKILKDLLRTLTSIKEVTIHWNMDGVKIDKALITGLPLMNRYSIVAVNHKGFITDDVLLGVIGTSTGSINMYSPQPEITAEGIAEAFRMIYTDRNPRCVSYYAPREAVMAFLGRLDQFRFTIAENTIKHVVSASPMAKISLRADSGIHGDSAIQAHSEILVKFYYEFTDFEGNHYLNPFPTPTFKRYLFDWLMRNILRIIKLPDVQLFWRGGTEQNYLNGDCDLQQAMSYAEEVAKKHPGNSPIVHIELQRIRANPCDECYYAFTDLKGKKYMRSIPADFEYETMKSEILRILGVCDIDLYWRKGDYEQYKMNNMVLSGAIHYAKEKAYLSPIGTKAIVLVELREDPVDVRETSDAENPHQRYAKETERKKFKKMLLEMETAVKKMETQVEKREKAIAEREKRLAERVEKIVRERIRNSARMTDNMNELEKKMEELTKAKTFL